MPKFEFTGGDPIEHFWAGHVEPGDVVELDEDPGPPWRATKRKPKATPSDDTEEEG
jgi:hypothetical protein